MKCQGDNYNSKLSFRHILDCMMIYLSSQGFFELSSEKSCPEIPDKDMKRTPLGFSCVSECQSTRHQTGNFIIHVRLLQIMIKMVFKMVSTGQQKTHEAP